jgi:hypothetical protein
MKTQPISIIVIMLVLLASACSPAQAPIAASPTSISTEAFTPATSIQDIVGTWQAEGFRVYLRFEEDGTLRYARALESLDAEPYAIAQIRFGGTQMFMKEVAVSGVPSCGEAEVVYEVQLLSSGNIQIVEIDDPCRPRAGDTALEFSPVP